MPPIYIDSDSDSDCEVIDLTGVQNPLTSSVHRGPPRPAVLSFNAHSYAGSGSGSGSSSSAPRPIINNNIATSNSNLLVRVKAEPEPNRLIELDDVAKTPTRSGNLKPAFQGTLALATQTSPRLPLGLVQPQPQPLQLLSQLLPPQPPPAPVTPLKQTQSQNMLKGKLPQTQSPQKNMNSLVEILRVAAHAPPSTNPFDDGGDDLAEILFPRNGPPLDKEAEEIDVSIVIKKHGGNGTPKGFIDVKLHEHQVEGYAWMAKIENSEKNGGLLADDMGLGKTIQTLALILGNKPRSKREYGHGTLIVCPVSLLRQWQKEIETKTKGLTVYIHHGPKRTKSKYELLEYDIVLTSYAIVTNERGKPATWDPVTNELYEPEVKAGPIFRARWHRVILDEAHYIKNKNAASSLACADLKANKRFCLTGTPIQNSADEMYSLFRFLRVPHFCEYAYFNEKIGRHIKMGKNDSKQTLMGMTRLQCALKPYLLRRTKKSKKKDGTSILVLPKRGVEIVEVEFSEAERGFYDALSSYAESKFNKYLEQGKVMNKFHHVLLMILRLRQACCHPHLFSEVFKDFAKGEGLDGGLHRIMGGGGGRNGTNGTKSRKRRQSNAVDSRGNEDVKSSSLGIVKDTDAALFESSDEEENRSDYHKCGGSSISMAGSKRKAPSGMKESPHAKKLRLAKTLMTSAVFERVMKEVNLKDGGILETECPHCLDVLTDAMITSCGHAFCRECITGYLSHKPANEQHDDDEENIVRPCPVCRGNISSKSLVGAHCFMNDEESDDEDSDKEEKEVSDKEEDEPEVQEVGLGDILVACHEAKGARSIPNEVEPVLKKTMTPEEGKQLMIKSVNMLHPTGDYLEYISSSKIDKMISILREIDDEDPSLKVIIFSQFTSMLDLVEKGLKANGMSSFKRYDGKMSTSDRADAIEAFFSQDDIPLMLVSLKAGSVGLNLTCACRVIMLDVWWNPAVEDQAIDRVHRIGQTRDVKVFRLIIKNSFEERILTLQENKRAIAAGALGEGELRVGKLSLQDLRFLFTNDQAFLAPVAAAVAAAQAADLVKDDNDGDVGEAQVDSAP
ncbi:hypothetical protein BCR33DRAFT_722434 [Rhizoclosmatium globosum]|uniref:P-loop containing nucleoside triphosphate hydrolase protein n=1 Tax=Rhizoclosmatium globosum TaxID=329046 RepID=A0A1Y2BP81_9FUNG|nr:hypothetical protein BCR33DRAFT_722434 [Rhizoclosmatium globosum]|eukprot:ORY35955.1 hypothetical protein BCR33DRAFT_722434 [Rhizoclosmatium globosum]